MAATQKAARTRGNKRLQTAIDRLTDTDDWIEYAVRHTRQVQTVAEDLGLPVHCSPHWHLVQATSGDTEAWFKAWRERRPPEAFAGGTPPEESAPPPPTPSPFR